MTYNTLNPMPSYDPRDLDDSAQAFDRFMHSKAQTEPDRFGLPRLTWSYVEAAATALTNQNVIGLAGLTSAAGKAFRFTGTNGQMATYDISSLGITLAGIADAAAGRLAIGAAASGSNSDITQLTGLTTALSIAQGGTGAKTAAAARSNLGAAGSGTNSDITQLTGLTTALSTAQGGTGGVNTFTALTLTNSWVTSGSSRAVYRKLIDCVQLEIGVVNGTATDGTIVTTLPVGFRPPVPLLAQVCSAPATTPSSTVQMPRVLIGTDGTIKVFNVTSASGVNLSMIFPLI